MDTDKAKSQTENARKAKARNYERRLAAILRERGWSCVEPENGANDANQ